MLGGRGARRWSVIPHKQTWPAAEKGYLQRTVGGRFPAKPRFTEASPPITAQMRNCAQGIVD